MWLVFGFKASGDAFGEGEGEGFGDASGVGLSLELANLTIKQIHGIKNKKEKVNFQNTQTTAEILKSYFDIELDTKSEYMRRIHKYWQMRHAIVHTNARVDERYVANVEAVGLESEGIGSVVAITKTTYDKVKEDFSLLLNHIEDQLNKLNLSFDGIDMVDCTNDGVEDSSE